MPVSQVLEKVESVKESIFDLSCNNEIGFVDDENKSLLAAFMETKDVAVMSVRQKIDRVENALLKLPQASMPVTHSFVEGLYIRTFTIPKGVMLTSKYHKTGQFDIMLTGKLSVVTDEGIVVLTAPFSGVSKPGLKRLAYAHEDILWSDIHANPSNERDIEVLEKQLYANSYEEMLEYEISKYREDFAALLKEYNLSAEYVRAVSENTDDQIEINLNYYGLALLSSKIEGTGVFASCRIGKGETIAPVAIMNKRTQVGRYTNHSCEPNAVMQFEDTDGWLVALRNIENEEVTIDYRQSRAFLYKEK